MARPFQERRVDATPDTVLGLLTGSVGEADDREGGLLTGPQVGLDLDAARLEADDGERDRPAQHLSTVRPNT
jgi:hypothetical protein